ncbi:MAG TPA: DsrE family protein [Gammaproteobacteria bacterium]|nr:DsrE family protein [Gammaproteobacteria bacterium]
MARYLLIESRDPLDSGDCEHFYGLAAALAEEGHATTFFLVQNGVLPARAGAKSGALKTLASAGVEVLADEFSLRERGIKPDRLATGVRAAALDFIVDQLADGCKAIWH